MNIELVMDSVNNPKIVNDILKNTVDTENCILELLEFSDTIREFENLMKL